MTSIHGYALGGIVWAAGRRPRRLLRRPRVRATRSAPSASRRAAAVGVVRSRLLLLAPPQARAADAQGRAARSSRRELARWCRGRRPRRRVEDRDLAGRGAVDRLVEPAAASGPSTGTAAALSGRGSAAARTSGSRPVQRPRRAHATSVAAKLFLARPTTTVDPVLAQHVQRLLGGDAEAPALPDREPSGPCDADRPPRRRRRRLPARRARRASPGTPACPTPARKQRSCDSALDATAQARLGAPSRRTRGFVSSPSGNRSRASVSGAVAGQHVRLVLRRVGARAQPAVRGARARSGRSPASQRRAGRRSRASRRAARAPLQRTHGFGVSPARVVGQPRVDDAGAELLAQVEREVRHAQPVGDRPRRAHRRSGAARRRRRRCRGRATAPPSPRPPRRRQQRGDRRVHPAAHRHGDSIPLLHRRGSTHRGAQAPSGRRRPPDRPRAASRARARPTPRRSAKERCGRRRARPSASDVTADAAATIAPHPETSHDTCTPSSTRTAKVTTSPHSDPPATPISPSPRPCPTGSSRCSRNTGTSVERNEPALASGPGAA